jgi:hypothetical protein
MQKRMASHINNDPLELTTTDNNDDKVITFVCDNTDCVLDPLEYV